MRRLVVTLIAAGATALGALVQLPAQQVPELTGRVVDDAGIISSGTERTLTEYFRAVENDSGAQIAILTVPSLGGEPIERYSIQVVEEWQLGQEGEDNGALILVSTEDRRIRIEVGFGLEGRLTDATSGVIIREYMQPAFQQGNFDQGFLAAAQAVGSTVSEVNEIAGVDTSAQPAQRGRGGSRDRSSARGVPINLLVFFLIFGMGSLGRMGRRRGGLLSALFWGSMASSAMRGHRHHGGFAGGGGGFGGGGFSGGGGGFGGGGASGGW
jgi:uncharacterized protein